MACCGELARTTICSNPERDVFRHPRATAKPLSLEVRALRCTCTAGRASKDARPSWWPSSFEARRRGSHLRMTDHTDSASYHQALGGGSTVHHQIAIGVTIAFDALARCHRKTPPKNR